MLLLTELAVDGFTEKMRKRVNFMLAETKKELWGKMGKKAGWMCFYGNILIYASCSEFEAGKRADLNINNLVFDG